MNKTIYQLIPDIQEILKRDGWFTDDLASDLAKRMQVSLNRTEGKPTLRLSQMGPRCPKALWHSIHTPELAEVLPPWVKFKYQYGHIIEELAISLAKAAGHTVTGEQDAISVDGVVGHRDCVVDGCILDVKSSSSYSFKKFEDGSISQDDSFGYLDQLDGYICGSLEDPLVSVKDKGYLLVVDKQLGHMCLYEHKFRANHIKERIRLYKSIVGRSSPPDCECGTKAVGSSGNIGLDVKASYNVYKHVCFPNLRTFLYSNGPVFLTKVVRKPDVVEVDKYGQIVYNS